jgi:hypothetical protein
LSAAKMIAHISSQFPMKRPKALVLQSVSERGVYETVRAPIGEPAVFYTEDSEVGRKLGEELGRQGLL